MSEEWKDIPGYEGKYQASSLGNIKSLDRIVPGRPGVFQRKSGVLMTPHPNRCGYLHVSLSGKTYSVHRLVALAFLSERPTDYQINHKDCNKKNNSLENLEYCTRSENIRHAFKNIRYVNRPILRGEQSRCSKITAAAVKDMFWFKRNWKIKNREISKIFNISEQQVGAILKRKWWRHVAVSLLAFALSSCRTSSPPTIEVCLIAPGGGADCVERDGTRKYRLPSEIVNYFATSPADMRSFSAWCYDTSQSNAGAAMEAKEAEIKGYPVEVVNESAP